MVNLATSYPFAVVGSIGELINKLIIPAFSVAGILLTFYLLFGAFKFLTAGGDKQAVSGARAMITHAIIGFFALIVLFLVMRFIPEFFHLNIKIIQ